MNTVNFTIYSRSCTVSHIFICDFITASFFDLFFSLIILHDSLIPIKLDFFSAIHAPSSSLVLHSSLTLYPSCDPGPEPPSNIEFSKVTENSLTVSWTKPKSPVSGFKVTYINTDDGEKFTFMFNLCFS